MNDQLEDVLAGTAKWAVVHGNCIDAFRKLPDQSIKYMWTDPPYGISYNNGNNLASRREAALGEAPESDEPQPINNNTFNAMRTVVQKY